jgi:DNA-binding CsgD family transcriptional regulator
MQDGAREDHGLTDRELQVLALLGDDKTLKQIADELAVSRHTVDTHVRKIYQKLNVRSRSAAVAQAARARILD